jgi:Kef-type K+ transport system membrane component KefB
MTIETIISICLGVGLAASVGFRVFLPLFALSLASYFDVWQLNESWQWIGGTPALIILGVATFVEIFAYFIPYVDNLLDSISVPLAAFAGTAVMMSTVADLSPVVTWALAIIAGGGTAAAISGSSSTTRLASTVTTAGIANPIVSAVETFTATIMSIISIFIPVLAIILVAIILLIVFRLYKKFNSAKVKNKQ